MATHEPPFRIRDETLRQLNRTFKAMMSPQWDLALDGQSTAQVTRAARALLAVQRARLRLGNRRLTEIRDDLRAGEAELIKGAKKLDKSLRNLRNVKSVLDATTALLRTVGRIVDLAV